MPYKSYTKLMTRSLVALIIHFRNLFLQKGSIIKRVGKNTILLINPNPDFNMKIIIFGYYAIIYTVANNNMSRRNIHGIELRE